MLRKDMAYNDRFRMIVKEFGRKILIEVSRGKAVCSKDGKKVTIVYNDSKVRKSSKRIGRKSRV